MAAKLAPIRFLQAQMSPTAIRNQRANLNRLLLQAMPISFQPTAAEPNRLFGGAGGQ